MLWKPPRYFSLAVLEYATARYFAGRRPVGRCLILGCGKGKVERALAARGFFRHCDAYDIAAGSITVAKQLATAQGLASIAYHVADVNELELSDRCYDAVFVTMALHHFANLEGVFAQIRRSLKPDGLLLCDEYVGPSRSSSRAANWTR
jgi:ubiquinone/menaquinone biosynthesis C-methylase UbiE